MSFLAELRRRNVVRVGAAYVVIGWVIAQVAEFAFENFGAPGWALKSVVVVLVLGLPVALLFAWAFELTPEGVKRERDVDRSQSITSQTGRKLDVVIIACLVLVGVLIVVRPYLPGAERVSATTSTAAAVENSIAVLPFADLSQLGDQEFFADGISEEILNVLVRIPGLKVAGRTSSFSFKGRNEDLREIGAALGVNHVLEGSVRRSGTKLRITAQLIRGDDGFHLWSETYDREVTDIFKIQDEIARAVADQLTASLGLPSEPLVQERTQDLVAYENFLRARQLFQKRGKENLDQALLLLNEAVARDPEFAPSWATIASVYSVYEAYVDNETAIRNYQRWHAIGRAAAERALVLNPGDGLGHAYLGTYHFLDMDWAAAFAAFERALELLPDDPGVLDMFAQNLMEAGYYEEAQQYAEHAVELDPLVAIYRNTLGRSLFFAGQLDAAIPELRRVQVLDETMPFSYANLFNLYLRKGELQEAADIVEDAVAAGTAGESSLAVAEILKSANDKAEALTAIREHANSNFGGFAVIILRDDDDLVFDFAEQTWDSDYRSVPNVFDWVSTMSFFNHLRWKEQVRKDGFLDLWRVRGFPPLCHPVEGDDFDCVQPEVFRRN
jgi:TolB-like protein/Tfp pilus assembly protein PilF